MAGSTRKRYLILSVAAAVACGAAVSLFFAAHFLVFLSVSLAVFAMQSLIVGRSVRGMIEQLDALQTLFNIMPAGLTIMGPDRSVQRTNKALADILGLTEEQLRQGSFRARTYLRGDGRPFPSEEFPTVRALADQREVPGVEIGVVREDGTTIWTQVSAAPLPDGRVVAVTLDITDRKRVERELTLFRTLVDHSPDAFYIVDTETGRILDANEQAERMLGYTRDELLRMRILDISAEVTSEAEWRNVIASLRSAGSRVWESRHRTKNGAVIPVELSVRRHPVGGRSFNIAVVRDITERKKVERDLRIKDNAIETSITGIAISNMDGVVTYANKAYAKMLGYDGPEEIVGRPASDFSETAGAAEEIRKTLRATGGWTGEVPGRTKGGGLVPRIMSASLVTDADGAPISILGSFLDISRRVQAERLLRESEELLRRAQRVARIGSWELDLVGNKLIWSDEIYRIFEIDRDRCGASYELFLEVVHPDDRDLVNRTFQGSVRDRAPYSIAHRLLMADGRIKHVQELGETSYDEAGRPVKSFGTVQDITSQKAVEEQVAASLREKETLLREIHHRVKNNLQVISSLLYFQAKKMRDPEGLAALRDGQDRLRSMILVHEKLYRSRDLANIDFGDYVRTLTEQTLESHASLRRKVAVEVDAQQVLLPIEIALPCGMILNELLTNIAKYAFPGDRTGRVTVSSRSGGDRLTMAVQDTGAGLPADLDVSVPQTFGLQLVRNLAQQLGGTVVIERAGGTKVTIDVPVGNEYGGGR